MKKITMIAMLAALSTSAFALKVGYVNSQELFAKYSQTKILRDNLTKEKQKLESTLQKQEIELQKLQVELQGKGKDVTETEKKAFEDKVSAFQKSVRESQTKLSNEEAKKMQEIDRLINISIQNVAKSERYDYVLEQGAIKFGGENITPKVLNVMEKSKKIDTKK
ncbi:OmpH family outer membrane protein [uncultured Cetobacterium sp.]|uniref:OmpH family outer membrane protein n=1 Tax=uncultured Cetobacterium sp. TaxID=527638 RepID=UPI0026250A42|nr:OmpH family outer membrane protein [uncultured Cetobacterium sp.]